MGRTRKLIVTLYTLKTSIGINRVNLKGCVIPEIIYNGKENYYISMRMKSYS